MESSSTVPANGGIWCRLTAFIISITGHQYRQTAEKWPQPELSSDIDLSFQHSSASCSGDSILVFTVIMHLPASKTENMP